MTQALDLHWLRPHPDQRAALAGIREVAGRDPAEARARIADLAGYRLDYMATLQLDRLVKTVFGAEEGEEPGRAWPEIRLALLGASTADHLVAPIRVAAARRRLRITPFLGGFGQYRQDLMIASSELYQFKPDVVLLAPGMADLLGAMPVGAPAEHVDAAVTAAVQQLVELWRLARTQLHAAVIQQSFLHTGYPVFGGLDGSVPGAPRALAERLNAAMRVAAAAENVLVLDLSPWIEAHGRDAWFDPVRWFTAKQQIAPTAAVFYGELVARLLAAARGLSSKCLVLDLDNTLWGGVIGDDGLDGIVLGQGNGAGEGFVAFQTYVRQLNERGVILAVCSKNDMDVAEQVFREHPDMVLKRDDIAAFVANWNDKAGNLRQIAQMLNIGLDSLVFFDDNPAEREIVRQTLPEVAVPEVPQEATDYVRCLGEAGYFEAVAFTEEDRARAQQYLANAQRSQVLGSATNMDAFLQSLDMKLLVAPFNDVDLPRITQLTGKTNQFNLTTRRHAFDRMAEFMADPSVVALSFRLTDRFGDNGLISVLIAVPDGPRTLRVDTWLMSCRVLGRQVEHEVVRALAEAARDLGVDRVVGEYIPTAKNGMVRDLYPRMGFAGLPAEEGRTLWSLDVPAFTPMPTYISVTAPDTSAKDASAETGPHAEAAE